MAKVVLTTDLSREFTGGTSELEVAASSVRRLIRALDERFPGLGEELKTKMAVAIDGQIYQDAFLESLEADSEVVFLPRIGGG